MGPPLWASWIEEEESRIIFGKVDLEGKYPTNILQINNIKLPPLLKIIHRNVYQHKT